MLCIFVVFYLQIALAMMALVGVLHIYYKVSTFSVGELTS